MPQFDFSYYTSQIFWLVICFLFVFFYFSFILIPRLSKIGKKRKECVESEQKKARLIESKIRAMENALELQIKQATLQSNSLIEKSISELEDQKNRHLQVMELQKEQEVSLLKTELEHHKDTFLMSLSPFIAEASKTLFNKLISSK
jgi:F-type H+-transporting ATPase subunit b